MQKTSKICLHVKQSSLKTKCSSTRRCKNTGLCKKAWEVIKSIAVPLRDDSEEEGSYRQSLSQGSRWSEPQTMQRSLSKGLTLRNESPCYLLGLTGGPASSLDAVHKEPQYMPAYRQTRGREKGLRLHVSS